MRIPARPARPGISTCEDNADASIPGSASAGSYSPGCFPGRTVHRLFAAVRKCGHFYFSHHATSAVLQTLPDCVLPFLWERLEDTHDKDHSQGAPEARHRTRKA